MAEIEQIKPEEVSSKNIVEFIHEESTRMPGKILQNIFRQSMRESLQQEGYTRFKDVPDKDYPVIIKAYLEKKNNSIK